MRMPYDEEIGSMGFLSTFFNVNHLLEDFLEVKNIRLKTESASRTSCIHKKVLRKETKLKVSHLYTVRHFFTSGRHKEDIAH